jgi:FRG domain
MAKAGGRKALVSTFADLEKRLSPLRDGWIFRGHADESWRLVPKGGRPAYAGQDANLFKAWKRRAIEHIPTVELSQWDWLSIAQHHGLATRLLDWTINPLTAAFFAVCESKLGPALIHAARFEPAYREPPPSIRDPLDFAGITIFMPRQVAPRISRQGGLFTIHNPPDTALDDVPSSILSLESISIKESFRNELLAELDFFGINRASLFPDLDGLSSFLNWTAEVGRLSV